MCGGGGGDGTTFHHLHTGQKKNEKLKLKFLKYCTETKYIYINQLLGTKLTLP